MPCRPQGDYNPDSALGGQRQTYRIAASMWTHDFASARRFPGGIEGKHCMGLLSIIYERRDSYEQAQIQAYEGYENEVLLRDAPKAPYDASTANIVDVPTFFGHAVAALAIVALRSGRQRLRVLDVGGALGGHFGFARTTFGDGLAFDWTVAETKLYVDYGRRFITTPELRFVDDLSAVANEEFDLTYLSSVLPYVPDVEALLTQPAVCSAPYLYVSRTGMHDAEINFLQTVSYDTGTLQYPGRILNRDAFLARMELGYDLLTSWQFEQHSVENRTYPAPSMLWRKR